MALYELLIRGKSDGTISGSHVIEFDGDRPGLARPVTEADWPSIAVDVNALLSGQVATLETEKAAFEAERDTLKAERDNILANLGSAIAAAREDAEDPIVAITQIKAALRKATKDEKARRREALQEEISKKQAELRELPK